MCEHTFVSSSGSPYARFRRALATGNLHLVHAAAAELPQIGLADALAIALLYGDEDPRAERAAVRWLARFALESPSVRIEDLRAGLLAFEALPHNPDGARALLGDLCATHGLADAAAVARSA